MILVFLLFLCKVFTVLAQTQCSNLGDLTVFYDPMCSNGESLGCNAGGQGQNCRFCGFSVYPPCPQVTETTASSTTPSPTGTTSGGGGVTISTSTAGPLTSWESAPDPVKRKYVDHPIKKPTILENHNGPIPTNSWYQNLLLGTGELVVQLHPTVIQAKNTGLVFSICDKNSFVVDKRYVLQPLIADWTYKTLSTFTSKKVKNLKDLSVTVDYAFLTGSMEIPLVPGTAFVTAIYTNLVPVLATVRAILSVKVDNGNIYRVGDTTSAGKKFVISLNSNTFWVLYSSVPISFKITANELTATAAVTSILKTGLLGTTDTSAAWDSYANGYVASADMNYQVNGDFAELTYFWNVVGSDTALMYALPHHLDHLVSPQKTGIKAFSIKGEMEAIGGKAWTMRIPLSTIAWTAKNPIDASKREAIRSALINDQNLKATAPDPYWFGLELARSGRLALIADELGETAIATNIRNSMKSALTPWLEGINNDPLRYDKTFGGLVSADGLADAGADYGNGYYNDHHFHYGYPVYAAAVIAKEDSSFYNKYSQEINMYVRDFANPSSIDPYFIKTRNKDWFTWHSWAAGLYEFGDNRNQESTGEAINGYYAVSLLGKATNNKNLDDFGRLLTAMEIISTKAYWQMPSYSNIYPESFKSNLMVGVLWSTKVEYTTFFGSNPEFIHGIQFLPFTPITEDYLDKRFMQEEKPFLDANVLAPDEDWLGYMIEAKAIVDKENQWNAATKLGIFHAGSSRTNCYYWIATR